MDLPTLRQTLIPLDFQNPSAPGAVELEYFRFYGIDFESHLPNLQHFVGTFCAADFSIACHYFSQHDAKGTCYVVHGYYDHVGLFGNVIDYWLRRGFSVIAFDLPGHGLSTGGKATITSFNQYGEVLERCIAISQQYTASPAYIVGQSTGATVIMQYVLRQQYQRDDSPFQAIILLAPLVRPAFWPWSRVLYHSLRPFIESLPRRFAANSNDSNYLEFIRSADPLQCRILPVEWVSAMRAWMLTFKTFSPTDLQALILQGQKDRTVDWRYNIKAIMEKFPNARIEYIEEGRHHLANESEEIRQRLFGVIDSLFAEVD